MDHRIDLSDVAEILKQLVPTPERQDLADRLIAAEDRAGLNARQVEIAESLAVLIDPASVLFPT